MQPSKRPLNKRLWFLLIPAIALVALLFWFFPRDLNLSQVKSSTIKNDKGQPAQLLWWTPVDGVPVTQALHEGDNSDGYLVMGDWWMPGQCFKVAELGNGPKGTVRVYLRPEDTSGYSHDRTYLAKTEDLSQTISVLRLQQACLDRFFSKNAPSTHPHN